MSRILAMILFITSSCGVAPILYALGMSEVRNWILEKLVNTKSYITNCGEKSNHSQENAVHPSTQNENAGQASIENQNSAQPTPGPSNIGNKTGDIGLTKAPAGSNITEHKNDFIQPDESTANSIDSGHEIQIISTGKLPGRQYSIDPIAEVNI